MIKKILVGLDGSKNSIRALSNAIQLAKQTHSSIIGLFVVQAFPTDMGLMITLRGERKGKNYKHYVRIAKSMCTKKGVTFLDVIEYGEEGRKIVSFANKNKIDVIVIGSRGMGKLREVFLGSTSNYVVHSSKIPVLIIK
ncbi:Universal stress protein YxiE [Marine Group I thaumarchaeote SCGC AAA799-E16]|uniref:Universal stress protein YxiE n=4 Tax=Marine Group I TaxID=905826 RepID=A0A087S9B4_9ARCH|nr:Universal stress protein YxiE [Marine Group I thaumarchaeote SCGC AAA799-E16]KFM16455.1 Universal stress protein YxiE [Marine Group I thaumarchaeote SCGC AAA799-D11]KFM18421.1 Universal stress protein [Marine Group I thaumarchaeote SCGC RSA3]KFM22318.1 Universal stress protein YxiE [Marine Group I thaumarchaeote SCGC AAA799-B03]